MNEELPDECLSPVNLVSATRYSDDTSVPEFHSTALRSTTGAITAYTSTTMPTTHSWETSAPHHSLPIPTHSSLSIEDQSSSIGLDPSTENQSNQTTPTSGQWSHRDVDEDSSEDGFPVSGLGTVVEEDDLEEDKQDDLVQELADSLGRIPLDAPTKCNYVTQTLPFAMLPDGTLDRTKTTEIEYVTPSSIISHIEAEQRREYPYLNYTEALDFLIFERSRKAFSREKSIPKTYMSVLQEKAQKRLESSLLGIYPKQVAHLRSLAKGKSPFGLAVVLDEEWRPVNLPLNKNIAVDSNGKKYFAPKEVDPKFNKPIVKRYNGGNPNEYLS